MFSAIIAYCLAAACLVFVIALPLGKTGIGATLRRWAGALFLLALAPSLFFGILDVRHGAVSGESGGGANALTVFGGLVLLAVVSYAILAIRKRLRTSAKDAWSEYVQLRSSGKRPVDTSARTSSRPSFFDEEGP
ncbi:MAG TPA: hypothetical protein VEO54_15200 [Thermoanaerobaculia bacterium]|nr:hypothetical protein [Thermoanaerobaculia bacterium]